MGQNKKNKDYEIIIFCEKCFFDTQDKDKDKDKDKKKNKK